MINRWIIRDCCGVKLMLVDVMILIMLPLLEYHFLFLRLFWFSMLVLYSKVIIFFILINFLIGVFQSLGERQQKKLSQRERNKFLSSISNLLSSRKTSSTTIDHCCTCWYKDLVMVYSQCLKSQWFFYCDDKINEHFFN